MDSDDRRPQTVTHLRVTAGRDEHAELVLLRRWLTAEDELRGRVDMVPAHPDPGEMGALSDTLVVALSGGGAMTVLARSLSTWLRQRRADVTIEIRGPGGRELKITAARVPDAETIIREILGTQDES